MNPGDLVNGDAAAVSVSGGKEDAGNNYTATASIDPANPNYTLTNSTKSFAITQAPRTIPAPAQSSVSKNTVTLSPVTPSDGVNDGTVEYGYATDQNGTDIQWQTNPTFTGLTPTTPYYFFARVIDGTNYEDVTSPAPC